MQNEDFVKKRMLLIAVAIALPFIMGCSDVPYSRPLISVADLENYLTSETQDTMCFNDGFDTLCIHLIPGPPGKDGEDGVNAQIELRDETNGTEVRFGTGYSPIWTEWYLIPDGKDGADSIVPGPPGKDGADSQVQIRSHSEGFEVRFGTGAPIIWSEWTLIRNGTDGTDGLDAVNDFDVENEQTIVHASALVFADHRVDLPAKTVFVAAPTHVNNSPILAPAQHVQPHDTVVHVTHLSQTKHVSHPPDHEIWHIAIREEAGGVVIYIYPRSLDPESRLNFDGCCELQGTREDVNVLLGLWLAEHDRDVTKIIGNNSILN